MGGFLCLFHNSERVLTPTTTSKHSIISLPSLRSRHNIPPNFYSDERVLTTTSRHNFPLREIDGYNKMPSPYTTTNFLRVLYGCLKAKEMRGSHPNAR
jgi:hypothetical protein